ncbi:MAG: 60S ribosomal export protein NMD3 [Candidatus Micrarchaeota archaeon]
MKKRFCPKCGATDKAFVRGLCTDCFLESNKIVDIPSEWPLSVCRECGKFLEKGTWHHFSPEALAFLIEKKIKVKDLTDSKIALEAKPVENTNWNGWWVQGKVVGSLEGEFFSFPVLVKVKVKDSLCSDCSLIKADYFEAELQLRFGKNSEDLQKRVLEHVRNQVAAMHTFDSLSQIAAVTKTKGGVDVRIGSKRAGKLVAERLHKDFGGEIKHSFSLAGVDKSGKTRKRYTFLVRI